MRRIPYHDRELRAGRWFRPQDSADERFQSAPLAGATVGLVGFGAVGQALAALLAPFRVTLLTHSRRGGRAERCVGLEAVFALSDLIVVSLPLTAVTRSLIDETILAKAAKAPCLVNVGRAEVIERSALLDALDLGMLGGVALDVPCGGAHDAAGFAGFAERDTTILSPHRAGTLRRASPHLADVADNLVAFAAGQPLRNVVDPSAGY